MRWLIVALLAIGPLSLLQGVAWVSMALQTDLSQATTGQELFAALEENLSEPCNLCKSVQKAQEHQDDSNHTTFRFEIAPLADQELPSNDTPSLTKGNLRPDLVISNRTRSDQPDIPPPRI